MPKRRKRSAYIAMRSAPSVRERPPSIAVVETIAALEGVDPIDLRTPLFEEVDPGALDALLDPGRVDDPVRVEFTYCGYDVTITGAGTGDASASV